MDLKIAQKRLSKLPRPEKGNRLYFDGNAEARGFAVRVTANGAISFVLNYRIGKRERRYTIGKSPEMSLATARQEALTLRTEIASGHDPLASRANEREAPTTKDLADDYFELYATKSKRQSSLRNDHQMLDNVILPKLGRLAVAAVTSRDVESLHASLQATPYQANRVLALLSKMFSLAIQWNWRADNPTKQIKKFTESPRERWLRDDELKLLSSALLAHPNRAAANAIRLLLLTGARKSEILSAEWSQFDLDTRMWTKPSAHTKEKRTEHVPISPVASKLLTEMKSASKDEYLFPGRNEGDHLQDLKNDWRDVCDAAKLEGVRIHDLRHTYASHLVSNGFSLEVVGKLLGHTQSATTKRYAHLADSPLREAANKFGSLISAITKTRRRRTTQHER